MIKKFLVAALTAVVFASSAEALSVKHDFTAFVGPFNASTAEFEYTLTKKSYAVRSVVRTNGTFGFLYPFEANYYTGGSIEGDRLETSAYRYTSQSRFNKRSKVMIYNEDGQPVFAVSSKNGREKKKEIEATADSKNTTNLQTVLAAIARQYNLVGFCDSRIPIFDGKRRFDAIFRDEGKEEIKANEYSAFAGRAAKCSMYIDKLGADAVYAGTPDMSLRTQSQFSLDDIREGIDFVHAAGKKIYLTLNLYTHNKDVEKLPHFVDTLRRLKPDGVLIADPGVFLYLKEHAPELKRFVSTQANICSYQTVKFWQSLGADLCVLGREVSFAEMAEIRRQCPDIMLETFVHGAMCMSYSGRCLISNFLADRSANQGKCAHCCRWHYRLHVRLKDGTVRDLNITPENRGMFEFLVKEDFRPGELYEIIEDEHGAYIMNSKDLCLMPRLNSLLDIGMHSLKIEGRNKTEYYAAITARSYRQAIDDYRRDPKNWSPDRYMDELYTLQNRGYCLGFYDGHLTNLSQNYEYTRTLGDWLFAGSIVEWQGDDIIFEVRNYINGGEFIEFLVPGSLENVRLALNEFEDADSGEITPRVSAGQGKKIRIPAAAFGRSAEIVREKLPQYTVARKPAVLQTDVREMLDRKKEEFAALCRQD